MRYIFPIALLLAPFVASAQGLITYTRDVLLFINNSIVPLLFAIALVFFLYTLFTYFFRHIEDAEKRRRGRFLIQWSVIALVLMVSIWGVVNLLVSGLGIGQTDDVCPDYFPVWECWGEDPFPEDATEPFVEPTDSFDDPYDPFPAGVEEEP